MQASKKLIEEIKGFLEREEYGNALDLVKQKASRIADNLSPSPFQQQLLLTICKTYYFTNNFEKLKEVIHRFELLYPDSNDIDYTIAKYYYFVWSEEKSQAVEFLRSSLKQNWTEKEDTKIHFYLGKAHFWNGDYFKANHCLRKCHHYYLSKSDHYMLGRTLYMLGYVAFQRSFFDVAENYFAKALNEFEFTNKNILIGNTYKMICIVNYRMGKYQAAKENLNLSEEHFKKCSSNRNISNCQIARARIAIFGGEYNKAEELLAQTYKEAVAAGFKRIRALSGEFLGEVYYRQGDYERSLSYLNKALELALEIAPYGDVAVEIERRLGEVYIPLGRIEEAEDMLGKAQKLCNHLGDKYELGSVYRAMGLIAIHKNDIDLAMSFFNEAIVTLKLIKESFELAATYTTAAEEYKKWSKREDAEEGLKRELLKEARSFAVEAMHLYSSIKLNGRVLYCKRLIRDIDKISGKNFRKIPSIKISFNPTWLYGDSLVVRSGEMKEVASNAKQLAKTDISILITGETGTGKEVIARYIHKMSDRAKGPFVAVNCASIPDNVFESELFGHKRGSFTGAFCDKKGLMEEANGGTLFLDEISELGSRHQAKLLRALEEKKIRRVGESKERYIDIRILSASNEDISDLLDSGQLRKDLYYRIAAANINIKPLRERKSDIKALFSYYLHNKNKYGYRVGEGVLELLNKYHWPGNVRELVNLTNVLSSKGSENKIILTDDFPVDIRDSSLLELDESSRTKNLRERVLLRSIKQNTADTRRLISSIMEKHNGNKAAAARELGVSRNTLYRRLNELGVG